MLASHARSRGFNPHWLQKFFNYVKGCKLLSSSKVLVLFNKNNFCISLFYFFVFICLELLFFQQLKYQNWFFTSQNLEKSLKEQQPPKKKKKIIADRAVERSYSNSEDECEMSSEEYFEDCRVFEPLRRAILEDSGVIIDEVFLSFFFQNFF